MQRLLYILFLMSVIGAQAQNMPERRQVRMGNRAYNRGDYTDAIERYTRATELAPGSFEANYDLGNALYKAERYDKAEQTMMRTAADTLRTTEERAQAFYNLGNAQFRQQKYKEALESYRQSLRLDPTDMEAKYNYAYTKKLLDQNQDDGGSNNDNQDQNDDQEQNQEEQQDPNSGNDPQDEQGDDAQEPPQEDTDSNAPPQEGSEPQPQQSDLSEQEQQQMLDAIQAQEDRTQDKLKEQQGVVVRGKKNW